MTRSCLTCGSVRTIYYNLFGIYIWHINVYWYVANHVIESKVPSILQVLNGYINWDTLWCLLFHFYSMLRHLLQEILRTLTRMFTFLVRTIRIEWTHSTNKTHMNASKSHDLMEQSIPYMCVCHSYPATKYNVLSRSSYWTMNRILLFSVAVAKAWFPSLCSLLFSKWVDAK